MKLLSFGVYYRLLTKRQKQDIFIYFDYILGDCSIIMLYVKNNLNEVSYTSSIKANKTGTRELSGVTLKYLSRNIPDALPFETKGGINGSFTLRYRL